MTCTVKLNLKPPERAVLCGIMLPSCNPPPPVVILIMGLSATGKTILAKNISKELGFPLIVKDEIAEKIFDTIGYKDRKFSMKAGHSSQLITEYFLEELLKTGNSAVVEGYYFKKIPPRYRELQVKYGYKAVQVILTADVNIIIQRYEARARGGDRHKGHKDLQGLKRWRKQVTKRAEEGIHPLKLAGNVLRIDTSDFADIDPKKIAEQIMSVAR